MKPIIIITIITPVKPNVPNITGARNEEGCVKTVEFQHGKTNTNASTLKIKSGNLIGLTYNVKMEQIKRKKHLILSKTL